MVYRPRQVLLIWSLRHCPDSASSNIHRQPGWTTPISLPLDVRFDIHDEIHITKKILQWRGLTKSALSVDFSNEDDAKKTEGLPFNVSGKADQLIFPTAWLSETWGKSREHWGFHGGVHVCINDIKLEDGHVQRHC